MNELELLRAYKVQNPTKYLHKYGDRTPEEVVSNITPIRPTIINGVKIDMEAKKEKELQFNLGDAPIAESPVVPEAPEVPAPKRGRKKNG